MLLYALMLFLHVLAVVVWVGGMWTLHLAVRPAAVELLQPAQRLPLMSAVLGRFLAWALLAVLLTLVSGVAMMAGGGVRGMHPSVHLMALLGLVMALIYAWVRWGLYPKLKAAVATQDWPAAGARLDAIRRLVATNLVLGVITIAVATVGRAF
jgi:uncharacterized membrane protein